MYELVFKNANILDGSGTEQFTADLAVQGDRIAKTAKLLDADAHRIIDCSGMVLSPGFVDMHGHSDYHILVCPAAHSKVRQGVTTEVTGNCGYSGAPLKGLMAEDRIESLERSLGLKVEFNDWAGFIGALQSCKPAINVAPLIGFNTTRAAVMAYSAEPANERQLESMRMEIKVAMELGAFGMSFGLAYAPGSYAGLDEMAECAEVVSEHHGIIASHIRSEGQGLIESIEEMLEVAERSGAALQVSHLKTSGKSNWHKLDRVFEIIKTAQAKGMTVRADRYPYLAAFTGLSSVLPDWVFEGSKEQYMERLKNHAKRKSMLDDIKIRHPEKDYWESIVISQVFMEKNRYLEGRSVAQAAQEAKKEPVDFICDLLLTEPDGVSAAFHSMSEQNLERIYKKDWVMIASDSAVRSHEGRLNEGRPHPRAYGTFPRALSWVVREKKWLDLPVAVRKMTFDPCSALGIKDRGMIKEGWYADLVLFDPGEIQDTATFDTPHAYHRGIKMVVVNGEITVEDGENTGSAPGKVLSKEK